MENLKFLQQLEMLLNSSETPSLSKDELTILLCHIKNLERCLADALVLVKTKHDESNKLAS